ncbi:MAG TPA: hypothetical protein VF552_03795 [Allosphingosinicella sp.]|jgi:hypothetical protein
MTTILPARFLRFYSGALIALGAAAYVSGGITADICSAYEARKVGAASAGAGAPRLC